MTEIKPTRNTIQDEVLTGANTTASLKPVQLIWKQKNRMNDERRECVLEKGLHIISFRHFSSWRRDEDQTVIFLMRWVLNIKFYFFLLFSFCFLVGFILCLVAREYWLLLKDFSTMIAVFCLRLASTTLHVFIIIWLIHNLIGKSLWTKKINVADKE